MNTLLLYGHEPSLLITRSRVLIAQGYHVLTIVQASEMERISETVGLLVFCYSVPPYLVAPATRLAKARWPSVKVLHLTGPRPFDTRIDGGKHFFVVDGPGKLVSLVRDLILPTAKDVDDDTLAPQSA